MSASAGAYHVDVKNIVLVVGLLVGCGGAEDDRPGGGPDGGPVVGDGGPDDPLRPVTVTALTENFNGELDTTTRVLFRGPTDEVVYDGVVDASGRIQAMLPDGGSVTAIRILSESSTRRHVLITTIREVAPGDELVVGMEAAPTLTSQGAMTTMTASFTPVAGAGRHMFYTGCGELLDNTSPATLRFYDSCRGATFDLLVVASGGTLLVPRFVFVGGITHAANGAIAVPGLATPMTIQTVTAVNPPPGLSGMTLYRGSVLGDTTVAKFEASSSSPPSYVFHYPQGVGSQTEVSAFVGRGTFRSNHQYVERTNNITDSVTIDLADPLPWLAAPVLSPTGLAWTTAVPGAAPDAAVISWTGTWTAGGVTTELEWRVMQSAATATTGMALPMLPAGYAELDPGQQAAGTVTLGQIDAQLIDYDMVAGYAAFRRRADTLAYGELGQLADVARKPARRRVVRMTIPGTQM